MIKDKVLGNSSGFIRLRIISFICWDTYEKRARQSECRVYQEDKNGDIGLYNRRFSILPKT